MYINKQSFFEKPPQSYWIKSTPITNYPVLNEDIKVDIAIIGGGMSGISCAYLLVNEGLKVAVIESGKILQGATGHTTAKITSQHGLIYNRIKNKVSEELAKQYADANETAIRFIQELSEENNIDCDFTPQPSYIFTQQDKYTQKIYDEVDTTSSLGISAVYKQDIPLNIPIKAAIRFDNQAQFHPRKYLLALANIIINKGCQIYEQSRAIDIEEENPYIITTSQGKKVTANKVILATHYPFYNKASMYYARIYSERSYVIAAKAKEKYPGGMYISAEEPTRSLRSQNTEDGEIILVGGEHHKTGQGKDTIKHYEALMDFADNTFSVEDISYRWSTQDCTTLDGIPYIGQYSAKTPDMYIATGYGKWGMTNSTVGAILLKDLIVHGDNPWKEVYNPSRKTISASAKNFIVENINVAKELVEGKVVPAPKDSEIKPNTGKAVEINGQRIGAYRDEHGELHLVNPTCTHMGCELNWNSGEKSWDCPCHGSRFTFEGDIIEGPAVNPLSTNNNVNTIEKIVKYDF